MTQMEEQRKGHPTSLTRTFSDEFPLPTVSQGPELCKIKFDRIYET